MPHIEVFADGSATTGKPGGYGWVIVIDGQKHSEGSGYMELATNNDAEMAGAIEGLKAAARIAFKPNEPLDPSIQVTLNSDSQITLGWSNGTYRFKQTNKMDKYDTLRSLMKALNAKTKWIIGHAGHPEQSRCDRLANLARKKLTEELNPTPKGKTQIGTKKTDTASIWHKGILKVIDFSLGIVEDYNKEVHGKRGSVIEIRESKDR
jgi:ribonuclease HI